MNNFKNIKHIYFIGIGGIGMSALAKYFKNLGFVVSGYDKSPSIVTKQLDKLEIPITYNDNIVSLAEDIDFVIYTPAIPKTHQQLTFFREANIPVKKRSEILGMIAQDKHTLAVAGTHGKTTTSSLITQILNTAGTDFISFMGGIAKNFNSNFLSGSQNKTMVVEADEYDRSFLQLFPDIAIVTAMDPDHLDIYGSHDKMIESYNQFISQIKSNGYLIINLSSLKYLRTKTENIISYHLNDNKASFYAQNIKTSDGTYIFDIVCPDSEVIKDIQLHTGGRHNIENTVAAVAACKTMGANNKDIRMGIADFKGVMRRFDVRIKHEKLIFIDDYAHHPSELETLIESVKDLYPSKHITGVFQPHLYSRTRDFADAFAASLDKLDGVILLDIYPARELPIEGISSEMLLKRLKNPNKTLCSKESLIEELIKRKTDILLTIGAGDIDTLVEPIEKSFKNILKYL